MEQAHTRLIAQLNERIAAPDNTPLYLKFAETVKNAVRSGVLEHGNILPGERDLSQLTGVSRITVRKAMQALEEEGVVTRSRGYGTQINNIFEYSLKEARGFSQQVVLRGQKPNTLWVNKRVVKCPEEVANHLSIPPESEVFLLKRIRYTTTQTALDRSERMENLHNAFRLRKNADVRGLRVLLIDDVLTTGSTLSECARVLKRAGAKSVHAATAARA